MGTKGQTTESQIFKQQATMKNKDILGPHIKAAGSGALRYSSAGMDPNAGPLYANGPHNGDPKEGGAYANPGEGRVPVSFQPGINNPDSFTGPGSESLSAPTTSLTNQTSDTPAYDKIVAANRARELQDTPIETDATGGRKGDKWKPFDNSSFKASTYNQQPSSFTQSTGGAPDLVSIGRKAQSSGGGLTQQSAQARSQSKAIYNQGVDAMNVGKDALASARSMTTGPGSASNQERRTAIQDARGQIKSGRKERNKANKATVIRSEFGKTRINNRSANAAAGGGTAAGNIVRNIFGGRKNPAKKQNRI
tara:strand:+ start:268 stop:1191 length:924 start_codon:yes stop_codon:yes gene_type:complete